jgi:hypothetical protein
MPDCDLNGWVHFLPDGEHEVSLHDFEEIEVVHNAVVRILKCRKCGALSIGWHREGAFEEDE